MKKKTKQINLMSVFISDIDTAKLSSNFFRPK